jgi:predicted nucleic acid-binding protein
MPPPRHPVVLDSDVVSLLWRKRLPSELYHAMLHRTPLITFVTIAEFWRGVWHAQWRQPQIDAGVQRHSRFQRLNCDGDVVREWGRLSGLARRDGRPVPANDCWIAACCTASNYPLLTRNRKDFEPLERHGLLLL